LQAICQSQSDFLSPAVARIVDAWPFLPPHIREAIQTLVEAASPAGRGASTQVELASDVASTAVDKAWRMAQECRSIVQTCLREEEWPDADREFFHVMISELNGRRDEQICST